MTTDTVMIELPRDVAMRTAGISIYDRIEDDMAVISNACAEAFASPNPAAKALDILRRLAANSDRRSALTKRENDAIIAGRGTEDFATEWIDLRDEASELSRESRDLLAAYATIAEDEEGDKQ